MYKIDINYLNSKFSQKIEDLTVDINLHKKVKLKRRKGYLYFLDYFCEIYLHKNFMRHYKLVVGFSSKDKDGYDKNSVAWFISSSLNLEVTILRLKSYLFRIQDTRYKEIHYYAETFLDNLYKINYILTSIQKVGIQKIKPTLPYCCFCWKRIEDSKFYCEVHHPKTSTNEYNKAKRRLIAILKIHKPEVYDEFNDYKKNIFLNSKQLPLLMYKWINLFSYPANKLAIDFLLRKVFLSNLTDKTVEFFTIISKHYPHTAKKLSNLKKNNFDTWQEFVKSIITSLDSIEGASWDAEGITNWVKPDNDAKDALKFNEYDNINVIIQVLARHEAYHFIKSNYSPKQSFQFSKKKTDLREKVKTLRDKQLLERGKVNRSAIARELGVTRQRISVLFNDI